MRFPAKITSSCISVAIPVDWVILHWYACVEDGLSFGRAVGRCTVTWLPHFLGWVHYFNFFPMVLRSRASRARAPQIKFSYNAHSDWLKKHGSWEYKTRGKSCHAICESHHAAGFKSKVLHFRVKNTALKDTNGKGKFKECSVFVLWIRKAFGNEIVLREIQRCFLHRRAKKVLFWNSIWAADVFEDFSGTILLNAQENCVFKREFMYV